LRLGREQLAVEEARGDGRGRERRAAHEDAAAHVNFLVGDLAALDVVGFLDQHKNTSPVETVALKSAWPRRGVVTPGGKWTLRMRRAGADSGASILRSLPRPRPTRPA
jgi:hypothetical protein